MKADLLWRDKGETGLAPVRGYSCHADEPSNGFIPMTRNEWHEAWSNARNRGQPLATFGKRRAHELEAAWLLAARDGPAGAWAFPIRQRLESWQARRANGC